MFVWPWMSLDEMIKMFVCCCQGVAYLEYLNLRPFMSQSQGEPQVYDLYAVLVHSGFSCHTGHYFCYIKVLTTRWTTIHNGMNVRLLLSRRGERSPAVSCDREAMASGTRWTIPLCPSVTSGLFSASRPTCSSTLSKWRRKIYCI